MEWAELVIIESKEVNILGGFAAIIFSFAPDL